MDKQVESKQGGNGIDDEKHNIQDQKKVELGENQKTNLSIDARQQQQQSKDIDQMMQHMEITETNNQKEDEVKSQKSQDVVSKQSSQNQNKTTEQYQTKYYVEINKNQILFGKNTLFPGSIEEVDVVIGLKDQILGQNTNINPLMLRVIAKCTNQQFNELDQYVFSVRSNERFQYFEEVRFKIRRKQKAQVKVAVKIPPVRENYTIDGFLEVQLENLAPVCLPITAKCEVPRIVCIKDLYKPDEDTQLIKIPAKKNQPRMPPIPFKNLSNFNFTLEVETIAQQSFAEKPFDIITQNFVNCQANGQFFVNMQLKENLNYKGQIPSRDTLRKILVLKIKNSSVFYHYPIEVKVFEGSNQSSMS